MEAMAKAKTKTAILIETLICIAGIEVFAVFSHGRTVPFIISVAGLVVAAIIINMNARTFKDLWQLFGFGKISGVTVIYIVISLLFGILIAVLFRKHKHDLPMPSSLTYFVIPALLIGATEELVFRGFIQGHTRRIGVMVSILFATLAHTAYKYSFILAQQSAYETDILFLVKWTIFGGFIFSLLKEYSNNIVVPIAGHALFDLLVYGDCINAPWWVWS
jgi:membrane protease YdiL (CAAX protease family)